MSKRYIDVDRLIDALIDIQSEDKDRPCSKRIAHSDNEQLSVKIGLHRKHLLEDIAHERGLDLSKVTRMILDQYLDNHFGNEEAIGHQGHRAWQAPREAMKC